MHKELKKCSTIGNKEGILLLCRKLLQTKTVDLSSIESACLFIEGVDLNFRCGLIAFEELGLITKKKNKSLATKLYYNEDDVPSFIVSFCTYCLEILIESNEIDTTLIKYNESIDSFQMPMRAFSLDCAVYRNMLITLGALYIKSMQLVFNKDYEDVFSACISRKKEISQNELLLKLERERVMGEEGEAFVFEYEKQRCPFDDFQLQKIKQISIIDASAGYDIISFHSEKSLGRRYIEVKTYLGNPHFYWSANELTVSKLRGSDYFIYLVDYSKLKIKGYEPYIICNPAKHIKESEEWVMTPSAYYVENDNISAISSLATED